MNRIFEESGIEQICTDITKILKESQTYIEELESISSQAEGAEGEVPSYVPRAGISAASSSLKSSLSSAGEEIERTVNKLENCRIRGTGLIPAADRQYAAQTRELAEQLRNLKEAMGQLNEFLADVPLHTDYTVFDAQLAITRGKCEAILKDAKKALDTLLANVKGAETISQIFSRDPVNLSTGNFIYDRTDLEIGGSRPFAFGRFYNSVNHRTGVLGRDWNHTYEVFLEKEESTLVLVLEQGKEERFLRTPEGAYVSLYQSNGELSETEEGFLYETRGREKYLFDREGRYLKKEYPDGSGISLYYEEDSKEQGSKRVAKIEKSTGEYFVLFYDGAGYLSRVEDHAGRSITYRVEKGQLMSVSTPAGGMFSYEYGPEGKLRSVTNPRGITTVENTFDERMRTVRQTFPDGSSMSYAYDDKKRTVELTERNGAKTTYVHDEKFRDIRHTDSEGTESFEYNKRNQKTLHVDKLGRKTQYGYDEKGNLTRVINALGIKTEIRYGEGDRPVSIRIDGQEKIHYAYNEAGDIEEVRDALGNIHRFRCGKPGRPEEILQPDGSRVHITYDERGNILELRDAFGSTTRFAYDALNRVTETTDGNGNRTCYEYDPSGNIIRVVNAEGGERSYRYNESGKVTEIRDFDGSTVKREYNALNRPCKLTDQEGRETLLSYDVMWNLARVTEPNGAKTTYIYNGQNRLERVRKANGAQVRYAYDAAGNRTGVTDEEGNRTGLAYDALGRLIRVTDPEGAETSYEYDVMGNMTKVTDACGNTVHLTYDAMGRLIRETNALGESRHYTYTALGKAESVTDEAGRTIRYEYEPGGRLKKIRYPDGTWEAYTYDGNGNVLTRTRETGFVQSYIYDSLDRIIGIRGSGGESKTYAYDAVGNVIRMTDGLGNSTHYEYTLTGCLKKVMDALGNETEYGYDVCDRLIEIRQYGEFGNTEENKSDKAVSGLEPDPSIDHELLEAQEHNRESRSCQITRYERDLSGQVTKITDALGHEEHYSYGKRGELLSKLDRDGYLTAYGYTEKGDINRIQYADGREVRLSYNPLRQLEELEDWLGITRIENDALGRAVKVSYPEGETVTYTYGKAGERTGLTYPDGRTVTYGYDELLRLTELRDGEQSIRYAYNALGRLEEKRFPGGITSRYTYDDQGRIESLTHSDREGILDAYAYKYDILGNKTAIEKQRRELKEESGSYAYGYDTLGRLSSVTKDGTLLRSYAYDAFGNRTGLREGERETRYTYNALNQLVSLTDGETTEKYAYDKRGNLTEHLRNGALVNQYLYGALNRLEKAVNGEGIEASYQYNGLGYRTGKRIRESLPDPEKQVRYTIDLTRQYHNLLQKEEEEEILSFLWDGGAAGMRRTTAGGAETEGMRPEKPEYYLRDDLGSPIRLLSENGELTESYGYDEFGRDLYGNQGEVQPFGYTGHQYDRVSDTYFAQAREYVPGMGRFVETDLLKGNIVNPKTMNSYEYCLAQPLDFIDLNGMDRKAAREYMEEHGGPVNGTDEPNYNPEYPRFENNCANFVSQTLVAGGVEMNEDWRISEEPVPVYLRFYTKTTLALLNRLGYDDVYYGNKYLYTGTWSVAEKQYQYFSDPQNGYINGEVIHINSVEELLAAGKTGGIQTGDLLYWAWFENTITHATVISKVENGDIFFSGNTSAKFDRLVKDYLERYEGGIYIIKLKDEIYGESNVCDMN